VNDWLTKKNSETSEEVRGRRWRREWLSKEIRGIKEDDLIVSKGYIELMLDVEIGGRRRTWKTV
jgi:succinate dehydrogenase flavin-adding protein (antitoxin of CptAB toxin-antitoxin module)